MNYAVHMTDAERAELERRVADADARIAAGTESLETLAMLSEEARCVRQVMAWADQASKGRRT